MLLLSVPNVIVYVAVSSSCPARRIQLEILKYGASYNTTFHAAKVAVLPRGFSYAAADHLPPRSSLLLYRFLDLLYYLAALLLNYSLPRFLYLPFVRTAG